MHGRKSILLLTVAGFVALCFGSLQAQEEKAKPEAGAQLMPPGKPPAEHKLLKPFLGKWKSHLTFTPALIPPQGTEATATTTCDWALDGWFLCWTVESDPSPILGIYKSVEYLWYDRDKETFRSIALDNEGSRIQTEWTCDEEGKSWQGRSESSHMGQLVKNKIKLECVSPDRLEWEWWMKGPDDDEYRKMMIAVDERIEKEAE